MNKEESSQKKVVLEQIKFQLILDSSPSATITADAKLNITYWNNAATKIFGYSKDEILGKPVTMLIPKKHIPAHREGVKKFFDTEKGLFLGKITEVEGIRKDGKIFPIIISLSAIKSDHTSWFAAIIQDITHEKQRRKDIFEKEMLKLKLTNLREIEKQKNEFSVMITHELKNPLVPIKGYCEILEESGLLGTLNPDQQNAVKKIYDSTEILENLISKILLVQRLGLRNMEWHIDNFDVNKFTNDMIEENSSLMKEKQIEFINTTQDEIDLQSDENKIREVFSNLIRNSVDFVPDKGGKIEIGAHSKDEDIEFYVKDNGDGIPKFEQKHLFKKFYQIDTSIRRKHGGTGVGLSICKGIVDGLEGKIWLESDLGKGTIFYFTIPKKFKGKKT